MSRLPAFFISHGSPMNAIEDNEYTRAITRAAKEIEKPAAIMVISAHWQTRGKTYITGADSPKQIYDFYGFPEELYNIKYEPKGSAKYAALASKQLEGVELTQEWGLDHGSWAVLRHMYPKADIPVFQISLKYNEAPEYHYNLGKKLSALREQGILIIGSGNVVHNLRQIDFDDRTKPFKWAEEFSRHIWKAVETEDIYKIINYKNFGTEAELAVPTDEHFNPLLYILGLKQPEDKISFLHSGIENGSLDMTCIEIKS